MKGDIMPKNEHWEIVDMSTFCVYDGVAYLPPPVTLEDKPLDRSDEGRWGEEVCY
jgi:hypothetical protein|tara:strand:+ start:400 stop:564 length:165 start_codon:yes stop_codon:yes gene_type:complete